MRHIFLKQMIILLLCVPFILFSSPEAMAQESLQYPEQPTDLLNELLNAKTQEEIKQVAKKRGIEYTEITIPIPQIKEAIRKENYAQVYSILKNNKQEILNSIVKYDKKGQQVIDDKKLQEIEKLLVELDHQYKPKYDLWEEVEKLNALLRDVKQGRAKYSDYVDQAKAVQNKNKHIIEVKNGFPAINTSVANKLRQDVGDLRGALNVLTEDVCPGVCK